MAQDRLETIVSLAKRRGFVYPSSEIYGGLRASWDYGPLGVELKNNINTAINQITPDYYMKILKYAYDRPSKYIRKVSNRIKTLKKYKN